MNLRIATLGLLVGIAAPAYAGTAVYTQCGAHDGYILLYRSTEKFDELAKLRCGERLEVVNRAADYLQISTADGKTGWLLQSDVTSDPPANVSDAIDVQARTYAGSVPALTLTNQSILDLHHGHASSDAIVSKIRFSTCSFNTSEADLRELKSAGVSDKVILAMLEIQKPLVASGDIHEVKLVVPGGTPIEVALSNEVSAEQVQQGTVVNMIVVKDVVVNGFTVISRGASARARVMGVRKPGSLERMGEIAWFMQDAFAASGDTLPLGFAAKQPNMIPTGTFQGYAFLLSQYRKGAPALVPRDRTFIAVVSSDTVVHVSQPLARKSANSSATKTSAVLLDR